MSAQHSVLQASPNIVGYFNSNSASFVLCSAVLDEEQWWGRTISFCRINSPFSPKQMISLSVIDVGGQGWMLASSRGPSGLGALSLLRPPYGVLPEGIRCFIWGWGRAVWGVITHALEKKSLLGERDWDDASLIEGGPPPSIVTPIPQPLCLWLLTRVAPVPHLLLSPCSDNRMGFNEELNVAPTPDAPAKQAPRAASSHFITLHQIKSNKLITNGNGHASSKYRINIIDLILSVLSEKRINAEANIKVLFFRATVTIR